MISISDIFFGIRCGIDTFDCVSPTRLARHGMALIKGQPGERINLKNAKFKRDASPLDERMELQASTIYSKSYVHHLFKVNELLGMQILAQHNVAVMTQLMREVREAIRNDTLSELRSQWIPE